MTDYNTDIASIYNTYVDDLYSYAVYLGVDHYVAMDAIHDVFYNLCTKEENLQNIQNLKFYLLRALKNNLITLSLRTKKKVSIESIHNSEDKSSDIESRIITKEDEQKIKNKIDGMLNSLTKRQREIVYLRYVEGYDYEKIAELMQISLSSCRKLVHKAMQTLRKKYPLSILLFLFI